jgi:DNA invertase Pin-like site-specific DNA recombinase
MKLDGYIRVSQVRGREGDSFISPDQQREQIERWAQLRGVEIAEWHTDLDVSGGKLVRPGLDRALERIRTGETGGLAVARLDRFSRAGVGDALKIVEEIHDLGGEIAAVDLGIDPTTPFGEFAMTLMLGLARMERRRIKDNWKDAQRRAVDRGIHIASKPPTGYRRSIVGTNTKGETVYGPLELTPDHVHVAEVFRMKAAGASWRDLALYLRAHDVVSPYGFSEWQPRSLTHVIANRAYLGEARSGEFANPTAHPPIIDEQTWQAAQEAVGQRPINTMGGSLLAGLLRCEGCGYVLKPDTMKQRGVKRRIYRCRTHRSSGRCPAPASVLGSVIEPYVVRTFMDGLRGMKAEGTVLADDLREAEEALELAQQELSAFLIGVKAADLGGEVFAEAARQRQDAVEKARAAVMTARERAGVADLPLAADLAADWPNLDTADRNRLLRAAFDAVALRTGRGIPITERASIYWRGDVPEGFLKGRGGSVATAA